MLASLWASEVPSVNDTPLAGKSDQPSARHGTSIQPHSGKATPPELFHSAAAKNLAIAVTGAIYDHQSPCFPEEASVRFNFLWYRNRGRKTAADTVIFLPSSFHLLPSSFASIPGFPLPLFSVANPLPPSSSACGCCCYFWHYTIIFQRKSQVVWPTVAAVQEELKQLSKGQKFLLCLRL